MHIWAMIMSFAGYSFCKPHSASYAQVSFKSAYLRAHYPAEFIAAVVSNQGGYYSAFAYLSEGRRMGLTILPPDINASEWAYTGSGQTVRVGFMQIKVTSGRLGQAAHHRATDERPVSFALGFPDAREARGRSSEAAHQGRVLRFDCRRTDATGVALETLRVTGREATGLCAHSA